MDNGFAFLGMAMSGVAGDQQYSQDRHYDNGTMASQNKTSRRDRYKMVLMCVRFLQFGD